MDLVYVLFNPNGRIGRKSFWIGWLIMLVASVVLSWIPVIGFVISLASLYVGVCVFGKRLHDMGKTAWLYGGLLIAMVLIGMITGVVAGIGAAASGSAAGGFAALGAASLVFLLIAVIGLAFTIWVGVSEGEAGPNKYGPVPAERNDIAAGAAPAAGPDEPPAI